MTKNTWVSVLTGILFLIHPLNTEAVAWASGRKDLLSALFFLLSTNFYLLQRKKWSLGCFALGLLAKVTILTLPAVFILIALLQKQKLDKQFWKDLLPYVVLMILFAVIAYFGKTGVIDSSTPLEKLLIAPLSTVFYLQKTFIPTGLAVIYPLTGSIDLLSARILIPLLICIGLLIGGLKNFNKRKTLFFGLAFFAVTLSPSLLNFSKGDYLYFASDRYAYIPMIGILYLVSTALYSLWGKYEKVLSGSILGILIILCTLSVRQSLVWANSEALFTHNITYYPEAHTAHNNLGNIYRSRNEIPHAVESYSQALKLSKEFSRGETAAYTQSKILSNLASAQRVLGDQTLALQTITQAVEHNPKNSHAFLQRGIILGIQGKYADAETEYLHAIALTPNFTTAKINLGSLYVNLGRADEAVTLLEGAVGENPFYPQAFYNLAAAYKKVGRNHEALESYEKAVDLQPAFVAARINLGILYAESNKIDLAIEQFMQVLKFDPDNARARSALQQLTR
jgi:tetratricopeptide (TPR) repeat protein